MWREGKLFHSVGAAIDFQARVIPPFVRIADFDSKGFQFFDGRFARGRAHPRQSLQIVAQRSKQIVNQLQRSRLRFRRKIFLYVDLTKRLAQLLVRRDSAALPARPNFLGSGQNASVEREIFLHKWIRKKPGSAIDEVPAIVRLPVGQRDRSQHAIERPEELRLSDVDFGEPRAANGSEVSVPGKMWG